jgi:predicted ester cyclase
MGTTPEPRKEGGLMSAEDNAAVARAWAQAAWLQHDLNAAAQYLAPDWVGHYAGIGDAHGVDGFKRIAGAYLRAFPDLTITVHDAFGDADRLVRRVSFTGTHRGVFLGVSPTGRQIQVEATVILRMTGGRIVEEWATENLLGLLQQLGAVRTFQLDAAAV